MPTNREELNAPLLIGLTDYGCRLPRRRYTEILVAWLTLVLPYIHPRNSTFPVERAQVGACRSRSPESNRLLSVCHLRETPGKRL